MRTEVSGLAPGLGMLRERLKDMPGLLLGVPAGAMEADGTTVATVAAANEFGVPERHIPERPVLRQGSVRAYHALQTMNAANLAKVLAGEMSADRMLNLLGVAAVAVIKREFITGGFVPNRPSTIARKRSSRPLIDTSQYRQSITYTTEDKAGSGEVIG